MRLLLSLIFTTAIASADLVITEVMSSSGDTADWFELTNNGPTAVDLGGYYWDDDGPTGNDGALFPSQSIAAGESLLVVEGTTAAFQNIWALTAITILEESSFSGPNTFSGLSLNSDQIEIWDDNPNTNSSANLVASASFGAATNGVSFEWDDTGNSLGLSTNGENGAFVAPSDGSGGTGTDIGSPGLAGGAAPSSPPEFLQPFITHWRKDLNIGASPFRVNAEDPNAGDIVTLTATTLPGWLTFTDLGNGSGQLTGTPGSTNVGEHSIVIRAEDNHGDFDIQPYTLHVFGDDSPVLLNEFNAVGNEKFLNGGDASDDSAMTGTPKSDAFFGRIEGNGGDWFELVVLGDGTAGSTMDLRGWSIDIHAPLLTETIKLSTDAFWAAVPVGTLLTFTERICQADGTETPTMLNRSSNLSTSGYLWSNVWIHDSFLIDLGTSTFLDGIVIGNDNTQLTIRDAGGATIFGPSGEGIPNQDTNNDTIPDTAGGVNSTEVFKLEANPVPGIDPLFANAFVDPGNPGAYKTGSTSSFGAPNEWTDAGTPATQDFAPYMTGNSPPSFSTNPVTNASGGTYSYPVAATDPNGHTITLSAPTLPGFLSFVDLGGGTASLTNNRPLLPSDIGTHPVSLLADDGQGNLNRTPQQFLLTVHDPAPVLILNEYNAVDDLEFLNGGDATTDNDGAPASLDTFFGRVAGNGRDWIELVVVGDGTASTTDLRGFKIQIGSANSNLSLDVGATLVLSNDSYWATVPNGTILTFTEHNTTNGGRDTGLNITNMLSTEGWTWTNVWLGDPGLLTYTSLLVNGYDPTTNPVTGLNLDENGSQILILTSTDTPSFGPAGEGVAPKSGVSATDVFELEDHPSPSITPFDTALGLTPGYDDGASASTFGSPNEWQQGMGGPLTTQDFSPFITTSAVYTAWIASFSIAGTDADPNANPDQDHASNLEEFLYGGLPNNPASFPNPVASSAATFTIDLRTDASSFIPTPEWSTNLTDWFTSNLSITNDAASPFGPSYTRRTYTYGGPMEPALHFRMRLP